MAEDKAFQRAPAEDKARPSPSAAATVPPSANSAARRTAARSTTRSKASPASTAPSSTTDPGSTISPHPDPAVFEAAFALVAADGESSPAMPTPPPAPAPAPTGQQESPCAADSTGAARDGAASPAASSPDNGPVGLAGGDLPPEVKSRLKKLKNMEDHYKGASECPTASSCATLAGLTPRAFIQDS